MSPPSPTPEQRDAPDALDDEMLEVLGEFMQESAENLDRVDSELVALEERPGDVELLSSIFRTMHTIKGTCGFFGFATLERVTHAAEHLLVKLRDGELQVDETIADALLATVDAVRAMLDSIAAGDGEGPIDRGALVERLGAIARGAGGPAVAGDDAAAPAPPDGPGSPNGPGSPDAPDARGAADAPAPESAPATAPEPTPAPRPIAAARNPTREDSRDRVNAPEATIRVDVPVLDALMDLVGELVLSRNQIVAAMEQSESHSAKAAAQALDLITADLQETVMRTRMQSIDTLWNRLPRVVRDLARDCGKRVQVVMEGGDTELDRGLLEAIKDPLTHLVRNCVDHGIEAPDARTASGKPAEGRLTLRAWHEGGQVHIEIGDDGAGIDPDRLVRKAVDSGVLDPGTADALGDAERVRLIFMAGLSTAEQVTTVSGRGVGMDVVRTNIERISGSIDVESTRGRGTLFRLRVPLTLAILPALIVELGQERFAIPQVNLAELLTLGNGQTRIEDLHGTPVLRLRGSLLPVIRLSTLLRRDAADDATTPTEPTEPAAAAEPAETQHVVVLVSEGARFGLCVDRIRDAQEIVVKPLTEALSGGGVYAGATIMGDGRPALVLDALGIAARCGLEAEHRACALAAEAAGTAAASARARTRSVLLVRDAAGEHAAVPLGSVDRLERIEESHVERSGGRELIRYRNGLLPLRHLDGGDAAVARRSCRTAERRAPADAGLPEARSVVVLVEGDVWVGLCVDTVLDVERVSLSAGDEPDGDDGARRSRPVTVANDDIVARLVDVPALLARHGGGASAAGVTDAGELAA